MIKSLYFVKPGFKLLKLLKTNFKPNTIPSGLPDGTITIKLPSADP